MERLLRMGTTHINSEQLREIQHLRDSGAPVKQVWERLVQYGDIYSKWREYER